MERRAYLAIVGVLGTGTLGGCAEQLDSDQSGSDESTPDQSNTGGSETESVTEEDESCETVEESRQEMLIDDSFELEYDDPGVTGEFDVEDADTIVFDIRSTNGQEVDLTIQSPTGQTEFEGTVEQYSTEVGFTTSGEGRITIENAGTETIEDRNEVWADSDTLSAGEYYSGWITLDAGESIEYFIRQLGDGARPQLVIEDQSRNVVREEPVSEVIDGEFTAPEDGEYYFRWENTAVLTSGNWRWEFERVSEEPVLASVNAGIEREFTEETEECN